MDVNDEPHSPAAFSPEEEPFLPIVQAEWTAEPVGTV